MAVAGLLPTCALAHSPMPAMEGFYVGLLHPVSTASPLLCVLALGLLLSHGGPRYFSRSWAVYAGGLAIGLTAGIAGLWVFLWLDMAVLSLAIFAAALAALAPGRLWPLPIVVAGLAAGCLGVTITPDPGPSVDVAFTVTGTFVGANVGLLYVAAAAQWIRQQFTMAWVSIGLRVLAAWIAAIAVLLMALSIADVG